MLKQDLTCRLLKPVCILFFLKCLLICSYTHILSPYSSMKSGWVHRFFPFLDSLPSTLESIPFPHVFNVSTCTNSPAILLFESSLVLSFTYQTDLACDPKGLALLPRCLSGKTTSLFRILHSFLSYNIPRRVFNKFLMHLHEYIWEKLILWLIFYHIVVFCH